MALNLEEGKAQVADGLRVGDVLAGKYRIERILGEGGMGVVASAWHTQLEQRVAIKFLLPDAVDDEETLARFKREARSAVKIRSEHVARVIDVGTLENGAPYMVMEYLEGSDLAERMRTKGTQSIKRSVDLILQAAEAVAEAHSLGVIHRDLKPANLFVITRPDGSECIKVLDFGISKNVGAGTEMSMTRTHRMMGSPFYMSPEQMASSRDVDARTDMWALAVTLYELLTGTTPFRGNSLPELCVQVTQEPPLAIRELRPEIPEGLENIILRCLEKKANDRYANFAELATALAPFGSSQAQGLAERIARTLRAAGIADIDVEPPPDSEVRKPVVAEGTSAHTHTQATWQTTGRGASAKRLLPLTAVATVGLAILIVVGRWLWAGDDPAGADSAASVSPPPSAETPAEDSVRAAATGQDGTPATEGGVAPEASAARAEPAAPIVAPAALSAEPSAVPAEEPTQTPVKAPHPPRSATGRPTSGKTEAATKPPPPGSEGDVYDYRK